MGVQHRASFILMSPNLDDAKQAPGNRGRKRGEPGTAGSHGHWSRREARRFMAGRVALPLRKACEYVLISIDGCAASESVYRAIVSLAGGGCAAVRPIMDAGLLAGL